MLLLHGKEIKVNFINKSNKAFFFWFGILELKTFFVMNFPYLQFDIALELAGSDSGSLASDYRSVTYVSWEIVAAH